jgi:hypothetical protein
VPIASAAPIAPAREPVASPVAKPARPAPPRRRSSPALWIAVDLVLVAVAFAAAAHVLGITR